MTPTERNCMSETLSSIDNFKMLREEITSTEMKNTKEVSVITGM
jgi:hypothetical protein